MEAKFNDRELEAKKAFDKSIAEVEKIDTAELDTSGAEELDFDAGQAFESAVDHASTEDILRKNAQTVKIVYPKVSGDMKVADVKKLIIAESLGTVFQADGEAADALAHAIAKQKFGKHAYDKMVAHGKDQGDPEKDEPVDDKSEALPEPK